MPCDVTDNRTAAQRHTHTALVYGVDTFLSGWGLASDGASIAAWACRPADVPQVHAWVTSRSDIVEPQIEYDGHIPASCVQVTVYVVDDNHPSLKGSS